MRSVCLHRKLECTSGPRGILQVASLHQTTSMSPCLGYGLEHTNATERLFQFPLYRIPKLSLSSKGSMFR